MLRQELYARPESVGSVMAGTVLVLVPVSLLAIQRYPPGRRPLRRFVVPGVNPRLWPTKWWAAPYAGLSGLSFRLGFKEPYARDFVAATAANLAGRLEDGTALRAYRRRINKKTIAL